jgi:hypothetical protein
VSYTAKMAEDYSVANKRYGGGGSEAEHSLQPGHPGLPAQASSNSLAAWRVARSDFRNLGLLPLDLLHINAILLRSGLRLLIVLFIRAASLRTLMKFIMQGIFFVPYCVL